MKAPRLLAVLVFLFVLGADLAPAVAVTNPAKVSESVVLLFSQTENGGLRLRCTATAFAPVKDQMMFLTAAHCVTKDLKTVERDPIFLSLDEADKKSFVRATIRVVGRAEEGYDFAILTAPLMVPATPLGNENDEQDGAEVFNVAAPLGLGKVIFRGSLALRKIDRPLRDDGRGINWQGGMLVQLPSEGGSSGSAVVSASGKIIGIIVGGVNRLTIAIPVSRFSSPPAPKFLLLDPRKA